MLWNLCRKCAIHVTCISARHVSAKGGYGRAESNIPSYANVFGKRATDCDFNNRNRAEKLSFHHSHHSSVGGLCLFGVTGAAYHHQRNSDLLSEPRRPSHISSQSPRVRATTWATTISHLTVMVVAAVVAATITTHTRAIPTTIRGPATRIVSEELRTASRISRRQISRFAPLPPHRISRRVITTTPCTHHRNHELEGVMRVVVVTVVHIRRVNAPVVHMALSDVAGFGEEPRIHEIS